MERSDAAEQEAVHKVGRGARRRSGATAPFPHRFSFCSGAVLGGMRPDINPSTNQSRKPRPSHQAIRLNLIFKEQKSSSPDSQARAQSSQQAGQLEESGQSDKTDPPMRLTLVMPTHGFPAQTQPQLPLRHPTLNGPLPASRPPGKPPRFRPDCSFAPGAFLRPPRPHSCRRPGR